MKAFKPEFITVKAVIVFFYHHSYEIAELSISEYRSEFNAQNLPDICIGQQAEHTMPPIYSIFLFRCTELKPGADLTMRTCQGTRLY